LMLKFKTGKLVDDRISSMVHLNKRTAEKKEIVAQRVDPFTLSRIEARQRRHSEEPICRLARKHCVRSEARKYKLA
jgi:hypothetical protein